MRQPPGPGTACARAAATARGRPTGRIATLTARHAWGPMASTLLPRDRIPGHRAALAAVLLRHHDRFIRFPIRPAGGP